MRTRKKYFDIIEEDEEFWNAYEDSLKEVFPSEEKDEYNYEEEDLNDESQIDELYFDNDNEYIDNYNDFNRHHNFIDLNSNIPDWVYNDDVLYDVFEGDPDNYWNID